MLEQNIYQRPMDQFTKLFLKLRGGLYLHVRYLLAVYISQKRQNTGLIPWKIPNGKNILRFPVLGAFTVLLLLIHLLKCA